MPSTAEKGQTCRIVETVEYNDLSGNHAYSAVFNLGQFARASALAPHFQWYRAAKVIWTYTPLFNVFDDGAGQASKPYLYTLMNRSQQKSNTQSALVDFQCAGARPVALGSTRSFAYKPNWCQIANAAQRLVPGTSPNIFDQATVGLTPNFGWLATPTISGQYYADKTVNDEGTYLQEQPNPPVGTNPHTLHFNYVNNVIYNGHLVYLDQTFVGTAPSSAIAKSTCQVIWEFKGAKNSLATLGPTVAKVAPKDLVIS